MNSADMSNLWLGTDLTCRMGTRNLPARARGELCHLAVGWRHSLGSTPTTPGCSLCSGLPQTPSEARDGPEQEGGPACPGALRGSGRVQVWFQLCWRSSCLSSLPGAEIEKGKEGCKGQTMSQKLQEGQREKQQACYWK